MKRCVPGIALALALLLLAACGNTAASGRAKPNTIRMGPNNFSVSAISITRGSTITFVDDTSDGAAHILILGVNGQQRSEPGAPDFGGDAGKQFQPGDSWTTPAWNVVGAYHVTCTVHPGTMNLTVTVTG